ncbi:ATP-binding protein [Phytoactinopolyspora halotolerans]|uniref:ATP-binding protein n=1 Tax=Phytoactinopolyspora halotolerans TaxID=1981512 RepID=A0A6L9SE04_9ACTN|nr:AAA family ATPase [Phytoactinopolyspora halotolerans]NEE03347.1 ATP-binding protein [Phytoactinopolyspora halotolerans]
MRVDDLRAFLRQANPWWSSPVERIDPTAWTADDRLLQRRATHDLGYRSDVLADVATGPLDDSLYVLRGPRRVGKSVVLRDLAAAPCARGDIDPRQIIYIPADTFRVRDLRRAVMLAMQLTRPIAASRRVWLFDEITGIEGWTAEIKSLRDNDRFGDDTVVFTGSSAAGAEHAVRDLGAGRAGESNTTPFRTLLPMTFRDFLEATGTGSHAVDATSPQHLQSSDAAEVLVALEPILDDLDMAWQRYLEAGGFPRAVAEHHRDGAVSPAFYGDLASWLTADIDPSAQADSVALLMTELHSRTTTPLNVRDLAMSMGYTRDQAIARLNKIVRSYAGLWCPQLNDQGRRVTGAQPKFYLIDPVLAWLGHATRPGLAAPDFTRLTESALAVSLARVIETKSPGRWTAGDTVGYSRTTSGKEVDFAPLPVPSPSGSNGPYRSSRNGSRMGGAPKLEPLKADTNAVSSRPRTSWT